MQSFKASGNDPWDPATREISGFRESSLRDPLHDIGERSFPWLKKTIKGFTFPWQGIRIVHACLETALRKVKRLR